MTYSAEKEDSVLISLGKDKFFCQAWLKYAKLVSDTEDVFDYMLDKKIGTNFASTFIDIASYVELKAKDLRKAEITLRDGIDHLSALDNSKKELAKLERSYSLFESRVSCDHT